MQYVVFSYVVVVVFTHDCFSQQVREVHAQTIPNYPIYSCSLAPQNLDCRSTGTGLQRVACGGGGNASGPLNSAWLFDLQWEVTEELSRSGETSRRVRDEGGSGDDDDDDDDDMDCDAVAI